MQDKNLNWNKGMSYGTKILKRRGEYKISHCYKCIPKVPWSCKCVLRHILTLFWWQRWVFFREQEVCVCSVYALFVSLQKYMTLRCAWKSEPSRICSRKGLTELFFPLDCVTIIRIDFPNLLFLHLLKLEGGGEILSKSLFYLM